MHDEAFALPRSTDETDMQFLARKAFLQILELSAVFLMSVEKIFGRNAGNALQNVGLTLKQFFIIVIDGDFRLQPFKASDALITRGKIFGSSFNLRQT